MWPPTAGVWFAGDGRSVGGGWQHVGELVDAARQLVPEGELIVAVHPDAHFLLGLPADRAGLPELGTDGLRLDFARQALSATMLVREVGDSGGLIVETAGRGRAQVIFPPTRTSSRARPTPASWSRRSAPHWSSAICTRPRRVSTG